MVVTVRSIELQETSLKSNLAKTLQRVEGWLYIDEAWALHEAVRGFPADTKPLTIVEIGSWKGRSTIALALGIQARGDGKVFAIDPHTGTSDGPEVGPASTVTDFRKNIEAASVQDVVELMLTASHEARPRFDNQSVDVLFVDGSHHYEDVRRDIIEWQSALKHTASVAFNDPSVPGVYQALRELVLRNGSCFRRPRLIQNTLFLSFRRHESWTRQDTLALNRLRVTLALRFQASRVRPYLPNWLVRGGHIVSKAMVGGSIG
jgi:SAM-dependent methyltransferase